MKELSINLNPLAYTTLPSTTDELITAFLKFIGHVVTFTGLIAEAMNEGYTVVENMGFTDPIKPSVLHVKLQKA